MNLRNAPFRIGRWRVDPALDEICSDGTTTKLEPRTMCVLICLAEHEGEVVSVDQLLDRVWTGLIVTQFSVYRAIAILRRALEDDPKDPTYIASVPRRGYRLVAQIEPDTKRQAAPQPAESPAETRPLEGQVPVKDELQPAPSAISDAGQGASHRITVRYGLILIALLVLAGGLWWFLSNSGRSVARRSGSAATPEKSIAVLPFLDLSEAKDQEYFADGMAEEILDALAKVPNLRLIARTSSFQFKGRNEDARSMGAKLNVAYVLEGSVRRSGNEVRITAQLIDTGNGSHRWSGSFDREAGAVLAMEGEVATGVARALQVTLGADELQSRPLTVQPEAYDSYLRGRHAEDQMNQADWERAVIEFQRALELDPSFAPAAELLARTDLLLADYAPDPDGHRLETAREAALAALRLDPNSATAHAVLADMHLNSREWAASERELSLGRQLEPRNSVLLQVAGKLAMIQGQPDDAIQFLNSVLDADPLRPTAHQLAQYAYLSAHRLKEAEAEIRKALQISPDLDTGHYDLALILLAQGQREAALKEIEREVDDQNRDAGLAIVEFTMGRKSDSDAALARLLASSAKSWAGGISQVYAARGELDKAFSWLDRAYSQNDVDLPFVRCYLPWAPLRQDPRFRAFLKKMNLPE
jgi:TolB-like protein/DNA-binding winged helix-turn-helix (wHTH) protein/Tfp pilus assembly protein PilF